MSFEQQREAMVTHQIEERGVRDPRVLQAMREVPRHCFVDPKMISQAYQDTALAIPEEQTISQPYIVALMAELLELRPEHRVLEVGGGSGYAAAVLARLADEVHTVERHPLLAHAARARLSEEPHVRVHEGDGTRGWPPAAPYDRIVVAAGSQRIPSCLLAQLKDGGLLVMPVGETHESQRLVRVRRRGAHYDYEMLDPVRFVSLIPERGWGPGDIRAGTLRSQGRLL